MMPLLTVLTNAESLCLRLTKFNAPLVNILRIFIVIKTIYIIKNI